MERREDLLRPFADGVATALREMAGTEIVLCETRGATGTEELAAVTTALALTTAVGAGRLVLSFPEPTAVALARRILGGEVEAALVRDCMGEVTNVVAGQAKAILLGTPSHFTLSTPAVVAGGGAGVTVGWSVLRFDSDAGGFTLYLNLPS